MSKLRLKWLEVKSVEDTNDSIGEFTAAGKHGWWWWCNELAQTNPAHTPIRGRQGTRAATHQRRDTPGRARRAKVLACAFAWAGLAWHPRDLAMPTWNPRREHFNASVSLVDSTDDKKEIDSTPASDAGCPAVMNSSLSLRLRPTTHPTDNLTR